MASDWTSRIFLKVQDEGRPNKNARAAKELVAPKLFPLFRYAVDYGLTVLVVVFLVAFVMHLLAVALTQLIVLPIAKGARAF